MAWTSADLDKINAAIASGVREVIYSDGSKINYRSLTDMRSVRSEIATSLSVTKTRTRVVRVFGGKGY
tara:strand:+ start:140 stop:343 length:204 start_codon:yes stop_codon:yes gene_type:complete